MKKLLFAKTSPKILSIYRVLYPLFIIIELLNDQYVIYVRSNSSFCASPLPIFSILNIPVLDSYYIKIVFWSLLTSLFLLSFGLFTKGMALTSMFLFFWIIGSTLSCTLGEGAAYINWQHVIVIFNLLILAVSTSGTLYSLENIIFKSRRVSNESSLYWPIFLLKFNLIYSYFAGGISKIQHGLDWMNGYTLQGHLLYTHLHIGTPDVLPFLSNLWLLIGVSVIVCTAEVLAPIALFSRTYSIVFIIGSLIFQVLFFFLIDLRWMHYFGWSYLIYFIEWALFYQSKRHANKI